MVTFRGKVREFTTDNDVGPVRGGGIRMRRVITNFGGGGTHLRRRALGVGIVAAAVVAVMIDPGPAQATVVSNLCWLGTAAVPVFIRLHELRYDA